LILMQAAPASDISTRPRQAPSRAPSGTTFAMALRDGLADLAYSFDGAFRPMGTMSLADRAWYGLSPAVQRPQLSTAGATMHASMCSDPARRVTRISVTPLRLSEPAKCGAIESTGKRQSSSVRIIRPDARRRCGPVASSKVDAGNGFTARHRGARLRASVGSTKLDVIVYGGGRLASIVPWTR
jgi:hypothetical protein